MAITKEVAQRITAAVEVGHGGVLAAPRTTLLLVLTIVVVIIGLNGTSSLRYSLAIGLAYAVAVLANSAVLGGLGEINLGTGGWVALGGYVCAIALGGGLPVGLAILLAMAATLVFGFIVAIPTVRLKGIFTALATFALSFAVPQLIVYLGSYTGGAGGMSLPISLSFFGLEIGGSSRGQLIMAAVFFVLAGVATMLLLEGRSGRRVLWVGEAEAAASVFGVRSARVKVAVWTWSAVLAGLAGALFALTTGFLSPDQFHSSLSINLFVGAVIVGSRSIWGALIGGLLVGVLPAQLQNFMPASATSMVYGVILLLAILTGSGGLTKPFEAVVWRGWRAVRGVGAKS